MTRRRMVQTVPRTKKSKPNPALIPHLPEVGRKVCLGCLPAPAFRTSKGAFTKGLKPWPHTFVEGICALKAPGVLRVADSTAYWKQREEREHTTIDKVPF